MIKTELENLLAFPRGMMALRIPVILFVLLMAGGLMTAYGQRK